MNWQPGVQHMLGNVGGVTISLFILSAVFYLLVTLVSLRTKDRNELWSDGVHGWMGLAMADMFMRVVNPTFWFTSLLVLIAGYVYRIRSKRFMKLKDEIIHILDLSGMLVHYVMAPILVQVGFVMYYLIVGAQSVGEFLECSPDRVKQGKALAHVLMRFTMVLMLGWHVSNGGHDHSAMPHAIASADIQSAGQATYDFFCRVIGR